MIMRGWMGMVLAAVIMPAVLKAQDVTAVARVDSSSYLVGDVIRVSIDLNHPPGTAFKPLVRDTLGSFTVLEPPSVSPESGTSGRIGIGLSRYDSGHVAIPPITIGYTLPGDTAAKTISTQSIPVFVALAPVDTSMPIKDLKPPIEIPLSLAEWALIVGGILAVAALVFFGYRYWKKRQRKTTEQPLVVQTKPPHEIAMEALGLLKQKKLWQQGLTKEYYSEVTGIIRQYFENRFHVMALEQTTDEILSTLTPHVRSGEVLRQIGGFLGLADLVKFAKFAPGITENEQALVMAYEIVEKTRNGDAGAGTRVENG
jgi:hypothetical protein